MITVEPVPHPDLRSLLPAERDAFVDLLGSLDEHEWAAPTECPEWTVKGVALHVLGDDLSLLARQRDAMAPGPLLYAEGHPGVTFRGLLDGFNEQWVHAAQFLSPALIVELLRITGGWTASFYDAVDPEKRGEPVGFFAATGPSPYWQISAREYIERWVHHHQVRRAIGRTDLGPEFLAPALEAIAFGLAAHLPDLNAAPGAALALVVPDVGAWVLGRAAHGPTWTVCHADPEQADATVRVKAALATPVFSRAFDRTAAASSLTLAGDPGLAERARDAVAAMAAR